jgi:hypothetical protein
VISSPYRTPSFYIDAPLLMIGKRNWLGVGAMAFSDKAGALDLATNQFMGSVALHMPLDKKSKSVFTIGLQAGSVSRNINFLDANFQDAIVSGQTSIDVNGASGTDEKFNSNGFDLNAGVLLKSQMNDQMRLELGASLMHILTPDYHLKYRFWFWKS